MAKNAETNIDWVLPEGKPDWLMGTGATPTERALVWLASAAAAAAAVAVALIGDVDWEWWQWALVLFLAVDVAGGVPANALSTAKRFYHSPAPTRSTQTGRILRNPVAFAALHVHPFVALLLPEATLLWAITWYVVALVGTAAVAAAPLYLERPVAAVVVAVGLIAATALNPPTALAWFGPVLVLKLVLMHAVREEPYRPAALLVAEESTR